MLPNCARTTCHLDAAAHCTRHSQPTSQGSKKGVHVLVVLRAVGLVLGTTIVLRYGVHRGGASRQKYSHTALGAAQSQPSLRSRTQPLLTQRMHRPGTHHPELQHARAAVLSRPPEDKLACISLQQDTSKAAAQAAQPPSEHEGLQGRHHSRKGSRAQLNNPKHQRSGLAFARALALAGALALALAVGAAGWVPAARLAAAACLALKWRAAELPWHKALAAHSTCEPCTDAHAGTKRSEMACKGVEQTLSLCAQAQQYLLQWHCNKLLAGWELCCRSVAVVLLPCAGDS